LPATKQDMSIAPLPQGWTWELLDIDGLTTATGVAAHHTAAMGMARRAAQSVPGSSPNELPDIVFG